MIWVAMVFEQDTEEIVTVTGPHGSEREADEYVVQTYPGFPRWETIAFVEPGETVILECGHRVVADVLKMEAVHCPSCQSWQAVLKTDTE